MNSAQKTSWWIRAIILINAFVFVDFGLAFLAVPEGLTRLLDIELHSASALADLRAVYGGLCLALGVCMLAGLRNTDWLAPTLFLVMLTSGGLAFGRVYSMLASGMPSAAILGMLATEVGSLLWAAIAYRAYRAQSRSEVFSAARPLHA